MKIITEIIIPLLAGVATGLLIIQLINFSAFKSLVKDSFKDEDVEKVINDIKNQKFPEFKGVLTEDKSFFFYGGFIAQTDRNYFYIHIIEQNKRYSLTRKQFNKIKEAIC